MTCSTSCSLPNVKISFSCCETCKTSLMKKKFIIFKQIVTVRHLTVDWFFVVVSGIVNAGVVVPVVISSIIGVVAGRVLYLDAGDPQQRSGSKRWHRSPPRLLGEPSTLAVILLP
ncbi:hypothetical protein PVAP13_4KG227910 [Panicum virgatum]|uniref:Uncharacterized protein n=1 Tax=Panicum virgatum TaxID=38727 RepID=A0A8T0TPY1_PANVG|nr:hypothetical protein PVAP13_4KG227910 [Panicum virgatum]